MIKLGIVELNVHCKFKNRMSENTKYKTNTHRVRKLAKTRESIHMQKSRHK